MPTSAVPQSTDFTSDVLGRYVRNGLDKGPQRESIALLRRATFRCDHDRKSIVVLAMGTIESARLALGSLPGLPGAERMGANLMAHLRSNLTILCAREVIAGLDPNIAELQASASFLKGRHIHIDSMLGVRQKT